ncbi:flagellar hook-basal body complex protein [Clostridium lundense]|uniref:flagellar hook-basal body complex protein n=1 Tax=Clostridium lundense TaxID=319475 RepID=UPI000485FA65|nr:flagellar hook-basal body complex protein [Clostridium lundense]
MLRSMYSGISGLQANQIKLDVNGNNIANVSTTAFKSQRVRFQDMLSQSMRESTGAGTNIGGTNPSQVGLGTQVAGIDTIVVQGNMQPTGNTLDFGIDGAGYFVVGKGPASSDGIELTDNILPDDTKGMSFNFTRDGSFTLDEYGQLLTSNGLRVMGYKIEGTDITYSDDGKPSIDTVPPDVNQQKPAVSDPKVLIPLIIPDKVGTDNEAVKIKSFSVDTNGVIKATLADNKVVALGQIGMTSFKNPAGLSKDGKNLYSRSSNSGEPLFRDGVGKPAEESNEKGFGDINQGMLEMSRVDLAEQFTEMIVATRAFQANGKMITTGDEILQELVNLKR